MDKDKLKKKVINMDKHKKTYEEGDNMALAIDKPIEATVEVKENKYIVEIIDSIKSKDSNLNNDKNRFALELLKRARRG